MLGAHAQLADRDFERIFQEQFQRMIKVNFQSGHTQRVAKFVHIAKSV
jgi:hypothetical protein